MHDCIEEGPTANLCDSNHCRSWVSGRLEGYPTVDLCDGGNYCRGYTSSGWKVILQSVSYGTYPDIQVPVAIRFRLDMAGQSIALLHLISSISASQWIDFRRPSL